METSMAGTGGEVNPLVKRIAETVRRGRGDLKKFHNQIVRNRNYMAGRLGGRGLDALSSSELGGAEGPLVRANLLYTTVQQLIQHVYARNPEIGVKPAPSVGPERYRMVRGFSKTLEVVLNQQLKRGGLKRAMKNCVRSTFTTGIGWLKVSYQREYLRDPHIDARLHDQQDNLARLRQQSQALDDAEERGDLEAEIAAVEHHVQALQQQVEVMVAEGLVVDHVRTEHMSWDPGCTDLTLWHKARWIDQQVFLPKEEAEARAGRKLKTATTWDKIPDVARAAEELYRSSPMRADDSASYVAWHETWNRDNQTVYCWVEGDTSDWVMEPWSPDTVGEKWYPFFPLMFMPLDGETVPLSMTLLLKELADEYNETRTQLAEHREISIPHWIAAKSADHDSIERFTHSKLGEVTLIATNGRPLREVLDVATPPPFNPALYDTSPIRVDFDLLSGIQEAAQGAILKSKTATEAEIMQQGLSSRVSETQDTIEDQMNNVAEYSGEVLLQELTLPQVVRIAGPGAVWPVLSREDIYDMVEVEVRPGTTGKPDKRREQQTWSEVLPHIERTLAAITQAMMVGADPTPSVKLLEETLRRFDERLDVEEFLPRMLPQLPVPGMGAPAGPDGGPPGAGGDEGRGRPSAVPVVTGSGSLPQNVLPFEQRPSNAP